MATIPNIVNVYPANNAKGVVIGDKITVLFDQAMDEEHINSGSLILIGPTKDFIFGRDFTPLDEPGIEDQQILNSPYTGAYVEGTFSFKRISISGLDEIDIEDTDGDGSLYRTEVTFTPSQPLHPGVGYTVLLAGDETPTDEYDIGVRTRTVFDTESIKTGTGILEFKGGFTRETAKTYIVEITSEGSTGNAEYIWWDSDDPLNTFPGITTTGRRQITKGVWVICNPDGVFNAGDTFTVKCVPSIMLENNYSWTFETGSGSIIIPPSTSSTSGIEDITVEGTVGIGRSFGVLSTSPSAREYSIDISHQNIIINFTESPDIETVIPENFSVIADSVDGDPTIPSNGNLSFSIEQVGSVVTLIIDPDQILWNNIIKVNVGTGIKNTKGENSIEYSWYYTTTYNPLYSSIRRIRFDLGPLITSVPNETIMFAIFEASLYVDAISFMPTSSQSATYLSFAKRELATCLAELMLVSGSQGFGPGDNMSKTLGDLSVKRGEGGYSADSKLKELRECIAKWEPVVQSGGELSPYTSLKPGHSVKGATAEDAITVGRLWLPTSMPGVGNTTISAGNINTPMTARRWVKNFRKRR